MWDVNAYDPYFSVSGNGTGNVAGATDAPLPVDSDKEDVALVTLRGHTDAVRHLLWLSPDIILSSGGSEKDPDIRMW